MTPTARGGPWRTRERGAGGARDLQELRGDARARGASLRLRAGATHALLGANGAGKSTLSRVISGHVRRDSGEIVYRGRPLDVRFPREALDAGIAIVMQETSLAPDLSVLENIFLPDLRRPGRLSRSAMRRRAGEILADLGQERSLSLDAEARDLSAAQRQLVEIAKALALNANLIIFDEPTASLSPERGRAAVRRHRSPRSADCAVVFVSHRLEEVFAHLRRDHGHARGPHRRGDRARHISLSQTELIRLMVGRDIGAIYAAPRLARRPRGDAGAVVENLRAPPAGRATSPSICIAARSSGSAASSARALGDGRGHLRLRRAPAARCGLDGRPFRAALADRSDPRRPRLRRRGPPPAVDRSGSHVRENLLLAHLGAHRGFGLGYRQLDQARSTS